ncbi:MAG: hypothetical protein QM759_06185 [Terricaulis sp.]
MGMRANSAAAFQRFELFASVDRFRNDCMPMQPVANQLGAEWSALRTVLDAKQISRIKWLEKDNARLGRLLTEFAP